MSFQDWLDSEEDKIGFEKITKIKKEELTMSSKWVEIRDTAVDALGLDEVGKTLKGNLNNWLVDEGLDIISKTADKVVEQCKKDAPKETGWCKVRDSFVLPLAIQGGVAVLKVVIQKAAAEKL
jgi:hypothetical protein